MRILLLTTLLAVVVMAGFAVPVFADNGEIPDPGITTQDDVVGVFEEAKDLIVTVALVLILIFLVYAGILYLTAGGEETKVEKAKSQLKYALIGAVVILGAQVIISTLRAIIGAGSLYPGGGGSSLLMPMVGVIYSAKERLLRR